jgi:hypothetical protein
MAIQLNFGSMESMDTVVMILIIILLLTFTILILIKFDLLDFMTEKLCNYETFEEKEMRLNDENDEDGSLYVAARAKRQKIYLLFLVIERVINSFTLIFLLQPFILHGLIPILLLIGQILYLTFYDKNLYNPPNKYRLYFNYLMGIMIQGLLMGKKIMDEKLNVGEEENDGGEYWPFTILGSLFLVLLVGLSYELYSIKKIRCFQLEVEWERVDESRKKQILLKEDLKKKKFSNKTANDLKSPSHERK